MNLDDDDLHDQLVIAYLEYFEANQIWERKQTVRTYYEVQKCIRKVRDLSSERHREIRKIQQSKKARTDKDKNQ